MKFPKKLAVYVTQRDIDEGSICDSRRCPIARAFNRVLDEFDDKYGVNPRRFAVVGSEKVNIFGGKSSTITTASFCATYRLPPEALAFIRRYDDEEPPFAPFIFVAVRDDG